MKNKWLINILLALMALIVAVYLVKSIEQYEEEQDVPINKELRRHPFLATQKMLAANNVNMVFEEDYRRLFTDVEDGVSPSLDDTVVLADAEAALSSSSAEKLLDWVDKGGFLIVAVSTTSQAVDTHKANALLKKLNVGVTWLYDEEDLFEDFEQQVSSMNDIDSHPIEVGLESSYRITLPEDASPYYSVSNEDGYTFVQLERGEGLITLMTEVNIWDNWQLEEHDNVILMLGLLDRSSTVFFFKPTEQPHWFTLLYGYFPLFVWLTGIFICLTIWYLAKRFGSVSTIYGADHSRFVDHIRVAGDFYWKSGKQYQMIDEVRGNILHLVSLKWPSTQGAENEKAIHLLSELSGWSFEEVQMLMSGKEELNQGQFTQCMKGLQQLRNML